MPYKSLKPCSANGCPELIRSGSYCTKHQTEVNRKYDQGRGTAAQRGYGANWQRLRKMVLSRDPTCKDPFSSHHYYGHVIASTEVDHIAPLREGGTNEMDNLQGLCKSCHSRKTATQDGRWKRTANIAG